MCLKPNGVFDIGHFSEMAFFCKSMDYHFGMDVAFEKMMRCEKYG